MTSIENYKALQGSGLRKFFEAYEPAIGELIDNLDKDGFLLRKFSKEHVTRLQKLINSSNMALKLSKDFGSVFNPDNIKKTMEKIKLLQEAFGVDNHFRIAEHYHSILVNTYIAFLERLKIYLLFFIDWNKMGEKRKDIHGIGKVINILKKVYPDNKYLNYFDSGTRNSLTHYTFFWKHGGGGEITLCSEIFDESPKKMPLVNFMMEINELQILTEGFYMMIRDKFGLPEIKSERMEK